MPAGLAQTFRARLRAAEEKLKTIDEMSASEAFEPGKWTRKQVVGHLLDSAANNHIRFVSAAIEGKYTGPSYSGEEWVKLHGYDGHGWSTLMERWRMANVALTEVVDRIPEEKLGAECRIGGGDPVTLKFVIEDYLDHLDEHVADIAG
jgi:hypothetical protein